MHSTTAVLVALFGIMITAVSLWGIASPDSLVGVVRDALHRSWGMWLAIGVRVALGVLLLLAAGASKFPAAFQVLGWLSLVAAAAIPAVGRERLSSLIDWLRARPASVVRLWLTPGVLLGAFLLYAVLGAPG